jgi:(p)ppGpp synthase/HD superfamily hydrolase
MNLTRALEIVTQAHAHQKDKTGAPYLLHLFRVMNRCQSETEKICALLHDLVEDTVWTFEDLEREGFSAEVIAVLRCVTKIHEDEDYEAFIQRVAQNPVAIRVKLADLADNMDITRLPEITEKDRLRLNKYLQAYRTLLMI